jgi:hypothetical protein
MMRTSDNVWRLVMLFFASLVLMVSARSAVWAQRPSLPAVNLGDTSFLDGIAYPGWVVEVIGQGVNDNRTADNTGSLLPESTNINSGATLTHIAWLSHARYLGAWYGAEVVLSAAYVDTGGHGVGHGFGDVTVGPVILQWPKHSLFGMPIYQRALLDINAPVGRYSRNAPVNIGSNAWDIHPYYAVTVFPLKKLETSWRIHYLWNGTNADPPISQGYRSTQAGQAIHFNATASYEIVKNVYVGANGYYLKQITDARVNGLRLPNSKEQIGAIGPGLVVHENNWLYFINGFHEMGAENMTEGNKLVLRVERVF